MSEDAKATRYDFFEEDESPEKLAAARRAGFGPDGGPLTVTAVYRSHPWTACNYDDEFDCQEQAVFGILEVGPKDDEYQACVAHVGEMCSTENWRGGRWRVWTL